MPEMNGWEVLDHIRQLQPQSRVIIITAHAMEETQRMSREKDIWAYLEKPDLIDKIKGLLEKNANREGEI